MAERFAPERLQLLQELEASLSGSRQALLALDLAGIEQGTREQVGLVRELQSFPDMQMPQPGAETPSSPRETVEEVRRCEQSVLQAVRVQAALLARAQRKLLILANMLAGPSLDYGCLFAKPNGAAPSIYAMREREF